MKFVLKDRWVIPRLRLYVNPHTPFDVADIFITKQENILTSEATLIYLYPFKI